MRNTIFVLMITLLCLQTGCSRHIPMPYTDTSTVPPATVTETREETHCMTEQTSCQEDPNETDTTTPLEETMKETEGESESDVTVTWEDTEPPMASETTTAWEEAETVFIPTASEPPLPETTSPPDSETSDASTMSESAESTESTEDITLPDIEPVETDETETEPMPPMPAHATAQDSAEIAQLVIQYLNEYRAEQGTDAATYLPGLTQYAEYRSRQIISDFSHNTWDERAAATALRYGSYVDPALYGMNGEPYYTAGAGEAIAKAGYVGTIDHVAGALAALIRNSAKHWCYIGAAEYRYIGVGITYESGMWYCDVAMTRENQG